MRTIKWLIFSLLTLLLWSGCASNYMEITPQQIEYSATDEKDGVLLHYKYDLLRRDYGGNEGRKGTKFLAVKISNNSGRELALGKEIRLWNSEGEEVGPIQQEALYKDLKQRPANYLLYLSIIPMSFLIAKGYETKDVQVFDTNVARFGTFFGLAATFGNVYQSSSANKKFKKNLLQHDIYGKPIPNGETVYGLIGIKADTTEVLHLKIYKD
ncbi:MAG: hypothetical protein R2798_09875 [Chitinophagales bacterium]|nr:hypothetical protein [Bacteroidota bacterium]